MYTDRNSQIDRVLNRFSKRILDTMDIRDEKTRALCLRLIITHTKEEIRCTNFDDQLKLDCEKAVGKLYHDMKCFTWM